MKTHWPTLAMLTGVCALIGGVLLSLVSRRLGIVCGTLLGGSVGLFLAVCCIIARNSDPSP